MKNNNSSDNTVAAAVEITPEIFQAVMSAYHLSNAATIDKAEKTLASLIETAKAIKADSAARDLAVVDNAIDILNVSTMRVKALRTWVKSQPETQEAAYLSKAQKVSRGVIGLR